MELYYFTDLSGLSASALAQSSSDYVLERAASLDDFSSIVWKLSWLEFPTWF